MAYHAQLLIHRFWSKVDRSGECWAWLGAPRVGNAYGQFMTRKGKFERAHRVAYMLVQGEIPQGMQVLHICDNRRCVNPEHLFLGTQRDNMQDMHTKGRWRYQSRNQRGEHNPNSILSDVQVAAMFAELDAGSRPVATAKKYGIAYKTLWAIRHRKL